MQSQEVENHILPLKKIKGIIKYEKKVPCKPILNCYFATLRRYMLNELKYYKISKITYDSLSITNFAALNLILSLVPFEKSGTVRIVKKGGIITTADLVGINVITEPLELYDLGDSSVNLNCKVEAFSPLEAPGCQNIAAMTTYHEISGDGKGYSTIKLESDTTIDYATIISQTHNNISAEILKIGDLIGRSEMPQIDLSKILKNVKTKFKRYVRDTILNILRFKNVIPMVKNEIIKPVMGTNTINLVDFNYLISELKNLEL